MRVRFLFVPLAFTLAACAADKSESPHRTHSEITATSIARVPPDSLLAVGEEHYWNAEYDSARSAWSNGLREARLRGDSVNSARFLMWFGIAAWKTGDFVRAREYSEQSLALKIEEQMTDELSRSYNTLGNIALGEYRLVDAKAAFARAVETAQEAGNREDVGRAAGGLGLVSTYLGDLEAGRQHLELQRAIGRELGNDRFQANALINLAMTNVWAGDPLPAIEQADSARSVYRRLEQPDAEPNALGQLATAYALLGDYRRAFAAIDTALTVARKLGLRGEEEENLRLAAGLHADLGDLRRAVALYTDAKALATELGFDAQRSLNLRRRAEVYAALENLPAAETDAKEALNVDRAAGARYDEFEDYLALAQISAAAGRGREADASIARAREIMPALQARGAPIALALAEARVADHARDGARVLRVLQAIAPSVTPGDYQLAWQVDALLARAFAAQGMLDSAVTASRRAVANVQQTRNQLAAEPLRSNFTADRADVFADLVTLLLRLDRSAEAFAVADAAHDPGLIGHLVRAREARSATREGDALLSRIDALLRELGKIDRTPPRERGPGTAATLVEVQNRLAQLRTQYEAQHIRAMEGRSGRSSQPAMNEEHGKRVQTVLNPDEAVVEYMIIRDRVLAFVITRERIQAIQTEIVPAVVSARFRIMREIWSTPDRDWRDALPAAQALNRDLFTPLRTALAGTRSLIIVPHGVLAQLPFAALHDARTNRFVVQDYDISYMPSAAALIAARRPLASVVARKALAFAPSVSSLPASVVEVRAVKRRVRGTKVFTGSSATESALRNGLQQPRIVHVASHGILNANNPMFSRLEVGRGSLPSDGDGRLEIHELLGLSVRSPLVFLSGCETGARSEWLNELVRGAGEISLSQAFLYAGASAVVATLWRIDDAGAARFAEVFYERLPAGSAAASLAAAQRTQLRDPRYRNPYFWAPYTLSGDVQPKRRS